MEANRQLGMLGAREFIFSTLMNSEERNYDLSRWRRELGIIGGHRYVGGSMFLARAFPFERFRNLEVLEEFFPERRATTGDHEDNAHVFERLLGLAVENEKLELRGL